MIISGRRVNVCSYLSAIYPRVRGERGLIGFHREIDSFMNIDDRPSET